MRQIDQTLRSTSLLRLIFTLFTFLAVTAEGFGQAGGDSTEAEDGRVPVSASPETIPLTVFVETYESGTTRGGSGGGSSRESDATTLLWVDPVKTASVWNLSMAMIQGGSLTYGVGAMLPSKIIDESDFPSSGYALHANMNYYFSGTPFYGFFMEADITYSQLKSEVHDLSGTIAGISAGTMVEIGGSFVLEVSAGFDIPLEAPGRMIPLVYNSDDGDITFAAGLGLGITL